MATLARYQYSPQYVTDLRQIIGLYIGYIPESYADMPAQDNFYTVLQNDPAIAHAMHLLSIMAAGEYFELRCKDEALRDLLMYMLSGIGDFVHVRKSLVYGSVLFGMAVQRKYYKKVFFSDYDGAWTVPYKIKEIDLRRMRIERDVDDANKLYWTIWCPKVDQYIILEDRSENPKADIALQDFIFQVHEFEEQNPYARGIGNALYALAFIKSKVLQYWADLCECWAKPMAVAYMDSMKGAVDAALGAGLSEEAKRVQATLDAIEGARARHALVFDASSKIDFHEAGSTGSNIINELLNYCDQRIQLMILGAELTTMAPSVGSYALGQIHRGATQTVLQYNRQRLEEVILRDIVYDFLTRNRANLYKNGIPYPKPGDVRIKLKVEQEEQQQQGQQGQQGRTGVNPFGAMGSRQ